MRISDWSSDVCSSDLSQHLGQARQRRYRDVERAVDRGLAVDVGDAAGEAAAAADEIGNRQLTHHQPALLQRGVQPETLERQPAVGELTHPQVEVCIERSEEHTSELQSLMRISYAVFCLKKKNKNKNEVRATRSHRTS